MTHGPAPRLAGRLTRRGAGLLAGTMAEERELMCGDLQAVLRGGVPRRYGEMPTELGSFECIAPSPLVDRLSKLKKPLPMAM